MIYYFLSSFLLIASTAIGAGHSLLVNTNVWVKLDIIESLFALEYFKENPFT